MALAATAMLDGETLLGVARYVRDEDDQAAEFALVVADSWQGRGIGARVMAKLIDAARRRGVKRLYGEILATNGRCSAWRPSSASPWAARGPDDYARLAGPALGREELVLGQAITPRAPLTTVLRKPGAWTRTWSA
jgi:GNAT superfamily N-acetyltransferase